MLKLDLSAPQESCFKVSATDLGLSPEKFSHIQVDLKSEKLDGATRIYLEIAAQVLLECDRSLCEYVSQVGNSHELLLCPLGYSSVEDDLIERIELDPRQRVFDLTDVIRDTLLLAIPPRKVAPEAEDLQLQTVYGAPALEVDQRWSTLLAVREGQPIN